MYKNVKSIGILFLIIIALALPAASIQGKDSSKTDDQRKKIEDIIKISMDKGEIPGAAICYFDENGVTKKTYGYADIDQKIGVTNETLFQLGSNSKAFTAYAIYEMINEGLLKEEDKVSDYINGFYVEHHGVHKNTVYNGKVDLTIGNLLHHTSGISPKTITDIKEDESLYDTVHAVFGSNLDFYPGTRHQYATINYDILGLIIQEVSGESYENYMLKIFQKLGLTHTYPYDVEGMALGYKLSFGGVKEYDAPVYPGNTPAGYIVSNIDDMYEWIQLQMGKKNNMESEYQICSLTQNPEMKNMTGFQDSYYASGWYYSFSSDGKKFFHGGTNPNYSSYVIFNPDTGIGVCVLTNIDTVYSESMAENIYNILDSNGRESSIFNDLGVLNNISKFVIIFCILISLSFIISVILKLIKRKDNLLVNKILKKKKITRFIVFAIFIVALSYAIYSLPGFLYSGADWSFAQVWFPDTIIYACASLFITFIFFFIYYIFFLISGKNNDFLPIFLISVISGLGNTVVILVINVVISQNSTFDVILFKYFILGLIIYIIGQLVVRLDLVKISNDIVFHKRNDMVKMILNADYEKFEKLDIGNIESCLNNDIEMISNLSGILITGLTSLVTVFACFIYLAIINRNGFYVMLIVVLFAAAIYMVISRHANIFLEKARTCQSRFIKSISDMFLGYKELKINLKKAMGFSNDVSKICADYNEKSQQGGNIFAAVYIIGESAFTIVIGILVFIFPIIFNIQNNHLFEYVFVLLYVTGPINSIMYAIPNLLRIRISWKRIQKLSSSLQEVSGVIEQYYDEQTVFDTISMENVIYKYDTEDDNGFQIGPISTEFAKGKINFIVGGNGSGKSTLVKILTGLYKPQKGKICINGEDVRNRNYNELFTTVYNDFYLFDKMYGIKFDIDDITISRYLAELQVEDKVKIEEGRFSTIKLSTGQRKRLALLLSYLEDKQIFLFDEWAADQDSVFRKIFYMEILPMLKEKGKCVIAVTHDDKYFDVADKIIYMDEGKIETH